MSSASQRDTYLRKTYGVTEQEWEDVYDSQGRVCAICKSPRVSRRHHTDHDHKTGIFRGILCFSCNNILRQRRTSDILRAAADYLDRPPAIAAIGVKLGTIGPTKKRVYRKRKGKK